MFKCIYCGREFTTKSGKSFHENYCKDNPNRIILNYSNRKRGNTRGNTSHEAWNKGKTADDDIRIKNAAKKRHQHYIDGLFESGFKGLHHSEETKKKISNARKKYLNEHKNEHVWKRNNKFLSKPCEFLKNKLKDNNINFVEEYTPFDDYNFAVDIAWPDIKIGIEINGNQHYDNNGNLIEYYQNRHNIFEERGWKIYEIHYTKCYKLDIKEFIDLEKLDVYDKDYVNIYFSKKEIQKQKKLLKQEECQNKRKEKEILYLKYKTALINLEQNSGIDFSKFGWVNKAIKYLKEHNSLYWKMLNRAIKQYYPEFFINNNVFVRK